MIALLCLRAIFLSLLSEHFSVRMLVHDGGISYEIKILIPLQGATKLGQIIRKATIPTMVPSRIRPFINIDIAVLRLDGEIERSFLLLCRSSAR